MPTPRLLLLTALTLGGVPGVPTIASAQQNGANAREDVSATKEDDRATNTALLNALLKRRAELVQAGATPETNRYAFDFLDTRIAKLRRELAK